MATQLYNSLIEDIVGWTNRPDLVPEMNMAIRNAVRTAHRAGKFVRDIVTVELPAVTIEQIQQIDYTALPFVRYRQLHSVGPTELDMMYSSVDSLDLFDVDGYARTNVVYVIGTVIHVRANAPVSKVRVRYYQRPDVDDVTNISDWIADVHRELIVLWAASTVLTAINETDIKGRVEKLAALAYTDMIEDSLEGHGR